MSIVQSAPDVQVGRPSDRHLFDRRLFLAAAIVFALINLLGFAQTYYLKGFFSTPPLPSLVVHLHGLTMTAWIALFAAQVWLVRSKQIRVHQRLGYAGVALGVLVVVTGFFTAVRAAKFGSSSFPPGVSPLPFLAVPIFDLLMFVILFGAAIYYRKRAAAHKSLMLLTAVNFLPPAIARIPIASLQALGPLWFFGFPTVLTLVCLGLDTWRRGRLNGVFLAGALLLIASYVVRLAIMGTPQWLAVAAWLTSWA
ncbi:MAG TPA: hypothetical protein VE379_09195 [Vicinamibacterales bacterium]|jgi:hypothetical protein|nr:hypothetical protein [Vicinamibacterales bacterium]